MTHSGGIAILLSDLAERHGVELPHPSDDASRAPRRRCSSRDRRTIHSTWVGSSAGPAGSPRSSTASPASGDFDCVLAVSTAHPPAHTVERVTRTARARSAGSRWSICGWQATSGDEGLGCCASRPSGGRPNRGRRSVRWQRCCDDGWGSDGAKADGRRSRWTCLRRNTRRRSCWRLDSPGGRRRFGDNADEAVAVAARLGGPVAMKVSSAALTHKTEAGGVRLGVEGPTKPSGGLRDIVEGVETATGCADRRGESGANGRRIRGDRRSFEGFRVRPDGHGRARRVGVPRGWGSNDCPCPPEHEASASLIGGVPGTLDGARATRSGGRRLAGLDVSMASGRSRRRIWRRWR